MKIKTQFIACIAIFSVLLIVIAASVAITDQGVRQLNSQAQVSSKIERTASSLTSVAIDYFLYQEELQLSRWQMMHASLHNDLSEIDPIDSKQQELVTAIDADLHLLNDSFVEVISFLENAPRNVSVRIDPKFQFMWSDLALEGENLASDASRLSDQINDLSRQMHTTNTLLIVSLVATSGALIATVFLIAFQKTLKSIAELQDGIKNIGSGDFNYVVETRRNDEIGELSHSFNEMTARLRTVTASKADLEKEIAERKKAEEAIRQSEKRFHSTLDNMIEGAQILGHDWRYIYINDVAERYNRRSKEELLGKRYMDMWPQTEATQVFALIKRCMEERTYERLENEIAYPDGAFGYFDLRINPVPEGVFILSMDISDRKKAEETLRLRNEELERLQFKLEEKAAEVEEYANQMEELAKERAKRLQDAERLAAIGATAGMVGHDIRNPLQAITGDLYFAKKDLQKMPQSPLKENLQESLASIETSVSYINKIVQDLQDYSRPIKLTLNEANLDLLCREMLSGISVPSEISTACHVDEDVKTVLTDGLVLKRILNNLASNAVQAMPKGGKLTLRAYREAKDVVVTVEDTGVGIAQEAEGKLFTPMFTTKAKGQGFGLAVVKRMTEALGGTVNYESEIGKGTKFIIKLPDASKSNKR